VARGAGAVSRLSVAGSLDGSGTEEGGSLMLGKWGSARNSGGGR